MSIRLMEGTPIPTNQGYPILPNWGVPHPSWQGGYPHPRSAWGGVPWGPPIRTGWVPPPVRTGWGYPPPPRCHQTEQQSGHLLSGGWYASCVHAGGLSLFFSRSTMIHKIGRNYFLHEPFDRYELLFHFR